MAQKRARQIPTPPLTGDPSLVKPISDVAPEILDAAVIAYLNKEASRLTLEIQQAEEGMKQAEQQMMAQFYRNMGQLEGRKSGLEAQLKKIQDQLLPAQVEPPVPPVPPVAEGDMPISRPPLTGDENLPIM